MKNFLLLILATCPFVVTKHYSYTTKGQSNVPYTVTTVSINPFRDYETNSVAQIYAKNLQLYEDSIPRQLDTNHVIVFPEHGLTGVEVEEDRSLAIKFAQIVKKLETPCSSYGTTPRETAVKQLSYLARKLDVYLIASVIEREDCETGEDCPDDGVNIFSTTIIFNTAGVIVEFHRKYNALFGETIFNTEYEDTTTFYSTFKVNFGVVNAFDLFSEEPLKILESIGAKEIIVPYAWPGELPFLTPLQIQYGWSQSNSGFNVMFACYETPSEGYDGCGIFPSGRSKISTLASEDQQGTNITMSSTLRSMYSSENHESQTHPNISSEKLEINFLQDNLTNYQSIPLIKTTEATKMDLCHNEFCCTIRYKLTSFIDDSYYQFLVFDGLKTNLEGDVGYKVQVCGIVACSDEDQNSCSNPTSLSPYTLNTVFSEFSIEGNFRTTRVLLSTLDSNYYPINEMSIQKQKKGSENYIINAVFENSLKNVNQIHTFALHTYNFFKLESIGLASNLISSLFLIILTSFIIIII